MTIESALYSYLSNKASITALVSTRIYPEVGPNDAGYPFITYITVTGDQQHDMSGASGLTNVRMQIDAWADIIADRVSVSEALRNALDGFTGNMGTENLNIRSCFLADYSTLRETEPEGRGQPIYRASLDFSIWHVESVPTL